VCIEADEFIAELYYLIRIWLSWRCQ